MSIWLWSSAGGGLGEENFLMFICQRWIWIVVVVVIIIFCFQMDGCNNFHLDFKLKTVHEVQNRGKYRASQGISHFLVPSANKEMPHTMTL